MWLLLVSKVELQSRASANEDTVVTISLQRHHPKFAGWIRDNFPPRLPLPLFSKASTAFLCARMCMCVRTRIGYKCSAPWLNAKVCVYVCVCVCVCVCQNLILRCNVLKTFPIYSTTESRCYNLLHLECHLISISYLNLVGLFWTERGERDLENYIINLDLRLKKWQFKCNR